MHHVTGRDVQKKWLNLRTCFSRELKAQKTKSGQAASKRRKYMYFEKLLFLKSSLDQRPTETNINSSDSEQEGENVESNATQDVTSNVEKQPNKTKKRNSATNNKIADFQQSLLDMLKEDLDEDKNFALSLVPTLKSLSDDEKFQAKIEILQILRNIKNNRVTVSQGYTRGNIMQSTEMAAGSYVSNQISTQYIHRPPPGSTPNSISSLQSYVATFSPSPQSDFLDL